MVNYGNDDENKAANKTGTQQVQPNQSVGSNAGDGQTAGARPQQKSMFTFTGASLVSMVPTRGTEYTNEIAKGIKEVYEKAGIPASELPKVVVIDNAVLTNLAYSSIIVASESDGNVSFFAVLLEATGKQRLTAADIISEYASLTRPKAKLNAMQVANIFTPDDALDDRYNQHIAMKLKSEFANVKKFNPIDGIVIPYNAEIKPELLYCVASEAFNAVKVTTVDIDSDLNVTTAMTSSEGMILKAELDNGVNRITNSVGEPVRADFNLRLVSSLLNPRSVSLNDLNRNETITAVQGYVEAVPFNVQTPSLAYGMPAGVVTRLIPQFVITGINTRSSTIGFMLLAIASSFILANKNMFPALLTPNDNHDTGMLNIITQVKDQTGPLPLSSREFKAEEVIAYINEMFSLAPMVSIDVPNYAPGSSFMSILGAAAKGSRKAAADLIHTLNVLTNGGFPANYDPNMIFVGTPYYVPNGTWADKTGVHDIRDVDLRFVLTKSKGNLDLAKKWIFSGEHAASVGGDPFIEKVAVINELIPDASISGKSLRVTLHPKFIEVFGAKMTEAGFNMDYEPEITHQEGYSFSALNDVYGQAMLTGPVAAFARQNVYANGGNNFHYNAFGTTGMRY